MSLVFDKVNSRNNLLGDIGQPDIEQIEDIENPNNREAIPIHANNPEPEPRNAAGYLLLGLLIAFSLYSISVFLAGVIRRSSAIAASPNLEFLSPPGVIIALHWLFWISMTTSCASGLVRVAYPNSPSLAPRIILWISLGTDLVLWAAYFVLFVLSIELAASVYFVSASELNLHRSTFFTAHPFARLTGEISGSGWHCTPSGGAALAVASTDESDLPEIAMPGGSRQLRLVMESVTVNWTDESADKIRQMERDLGYCQSGMRPDGDMGHVDSIDGFMALGFVWGNEEATTGMGFGSAFTWAWFGGGVFYVYSVDSIPVLRMDIRKTDAVVGHIPGCSEVWSQCN
jgi:hypothetical protein